MGQLTGRRRARDGLRLEVCSVIYYCEQKHGATSVARTARPLQSSRPGAGRPERQLAAFNSSRATRLRHNDGRPQSARPKPQQQAKEEPIDWAMIAWRLNRRPTTQSKPGLILPLEQEGTT